MNIRLARRKSPLELFEVARLGGEAESVKRVMGKVLLQESDVILTQLAAVKPDFGTYAFLAGQAQVIRKLLTSLDLSLEEARDAGEKLRKGGV